jgi:hypothetical protein
MTLFNALIRTHHITSRKKVATLKAAAKKLQVYALLRSGGVPGVMVVQGETEESVKRWVDTVHELRYKDYDLAVPVSPQMNQAAWVGERGILEEVATVKEMGARIADEELRTWWRQGMGFEKAAD